MYHIHVSAISTYSCKYCSLTILIFVVQNVASRGLDLPDVRWIVQYTTPGAVQDYVHRVGRTARVGKQGHALLFIMPAEVQYLKSLAGHGIRYLYSEFLFRNLYRYKNILSSKIEPICADFRFFIINVVNPLHVKMNCHFRDYLDLMFLRKFIINFTVWKKSTWLTY